MWFTIRINRFNACFKLYFSFSSAVRSVSGFGMAPFKFLVLVATLPLFHGFRAGTDRATVGQLRHRDSDCSTSPLQGRSAYSCIVSGWLPGAALFLLSKMFTPLPATGRIPAHTCGLMPCLPSSNRRLSSCAKFPLSHVVHLRYNVNIRRQAHEEKQKTFPW